jgi:hypothetical protein
MPRVRVPNASFIASADFPVLPFLAPRVFAESPILRRSDRNDGKRYGAQKEEETAGRDERGMRDAFTASATGCRIWKDSQCSLQRHASASSASIMLHTARPRCTLTNRCRTLLLEHLGLRTPTRTKLSYSWHSFWQGRKPEEAAASGVQPSPYREQSVDTDPTRPKACGKTSNSLESRTRAACQPSCP